MLPRSAEGGAGLLLGQGQAVLVQLRVQLSQQDASLHRHLLILLVHLQETRVGSEDPGHAGPSSPHSRDWDGGAAL